MIVAAALPEDTIGAILVSVPITNEGKFLGKPAPDTIRSTFSLTASLTISV